jgi:hypothetical protein
MHGKVPPRTTALALAFAIPFVVLSSAAICLLFGMRPLPVSKGTFRVVSFLQAVVAGLLFGMWLHFLPCALWMACDHPSSGPNEATRMFLMAVGWSVFSVVSWAVCLTGTCVFGVVREKREGDQYSEQLEDTPEERQPSDGRVSEKREEV